MRVLTYVNGELTVIRDNEFYKKQDTKPSFISGTNFYYEPTLKQMDNKPLTPKLEVYADKFITNFVFPTVKKSIQKNKVHCVDTDGNYIGYIINDNNYIEVPTAPNNDNEKWLNGSWTEAVLINKTTKYFNGIGDNRTAKNTIYAPNTMPSDFSLNYYFWNGSNWDIKINDAKECRKSKIRRAQAKAINKIIGLTAYLEPTSFNLQEQEARAWNKDNTTSTPFLDNLLLARDIKGTKQELVNKIIKNADAYKIEYAKILGKFQSLMKKIDACTTVDEVIAINWN